MGTLTRTRAPPSTRFSSTNLPPTPVATLDKAAQIAREVGLQYVYVGNVAGHEMNSTLCPECGKLLIRRSGFHILENNIRDGKCPQCGHAIYGMSAAG